MMRDRLVILRELLHENGYIFVILDDNAIFHCKLLMDEIFGKDNFLGNIVWQSRKSVSNDTFVSLSTNHILLYAKNKESNSKADFKLEADEDKFSNPDNDPRGKWVADPSMHLKFGQISPIKLKTQIQVKNFYQLQEDIGELKKQNI